MTAKKIYKSAWRAMRLKSEKLMMESTAINIMVSRLTTIKCQFDVLSWREIYKKSKGRSNYLVLN